MSYVLRGLGKHRYLAPLVTGGLGIKHILLPGGVVIGLVQAHLVVGQAGPYPGLAQVYCHSMRVGVQAHRLVGRVQAHVVRALMWVLGRSDADEL